MLRQRLPPVTAAISSCVSSRISLAASFFTFSVMAVSFRWVSLGWCRAGVVNVESPRALSRDSKKTYHALVVTVVLRGEVMGDYFCPLSYVDIVSFSGPASWQNDELCSA
jgi:hypothetical protein